ncbi:MAG: acyltransferase 3 [Acidobacteriales bacterium]|nr:acyltransferase 3 [Terriglobales bacterium]
MVIGHSYDGSHFSASKNILWKIVGSASLGVSIFFVLSGFLITSILLDEWNKSQTISVKTFYFRRSLRIFPAFYFYLLVVAILGIFHILQITKADLLSAGFYVWNYSPWAQSWALDHIWSLSMEEQFYLIWPAILVFSLKKGGRPLATKVCIALIVATPFVRVATYLFGNSWLYHHMFFTTHTRIDVIMMGCLGALLWHEARLQTALARIPSLSIAAIAIYVAFVSPLFLAMFGGRYMFSVGFSLEAICILTIMLWLVTHYDSLAGRALHHPVLVHIGRISYSIYLWQMIFLYEANTSVFGSPGIDLISIFLCAEFSYFCIEWPFLRLRDRKRVFAAAAG